MCPDPEDMEIFVCTLCGESVKPATERAFAFGDEDVLCYACAVRRGGRYDDAEDRWTVPPKVADLQHEEQ